MKRFILISAIALAASFLCGNSIAAPATDQERTTMATLYPEFKPSVIYLTDGRKLNQNLTNVFLKNSSLVYLWEPSPWRPTWTTLPMWSSTTASSTS